MPGLDLIGFGGAVLAEGPAAWPGFGSATNLLLETQTFNGTSWVKGGGSAVTTNSAVAPDGTTTADGYESAAHASDGAYIQQGPVGVSAGAYTESFFVKRNTWRWCALSIYDDGPGAHNRAWFDLQNNVLGTRSAGLSGSAIVVYSSGWVKISVTRTITGSQAYSNFILTDADNDVAQASGSGPDAVYLWGAQLETGTSATNYNNSSP